MRIYLVVFIFILGCKNEVQNNEYYILTPDSITQRIFKIDMIHNLNKDEKSVVDSLVLVGVRELFDVPEGYITKNDEVLNLNKGYFQYLSYIDIHGEKIVFLNYYCELKSSDAIDRLNKEIISINDGGLCYWDGYINLTKKTVDLAFR
ncbi:MAG: hypothetical protein OEW75_00420 [Cyclobacteriaceae bacterium]|nr:hypothetical protein [Cyclobacteriaceae bacterium]